MHWQGQLRLTDGTIDDMQTCFRGAAFTSPQPGETEFHTRVNRVVGRDARHVELDMYSSKNPNVMTPAMQGVVLDVTASRTAKLVAEFNGHTYEHPIAELLEGARGAFSARMALRGRAVRTRTARGGFLRRALHVDDKAQRDTDYYYVRVRQRDGQWGWSSPIWVERV